MESRILVVFVVFLMTWKEILNNEINPENNLHEDEKKYHESDHADYLNRIKQNKDAREATNIPTEPTKLINSVPEPQSTLPDVSLVNNVLAETVIPRRNIVKTQPKNINTKLNRNTNAPYVLFINKNKLKDSNNGKQSKVNETLINTKIKKVEEKVPLDKEVVDTKTAKKIPNLDLTLRKNQNELLNEIIKSKEPQAVRPKPKSRTSKKESKNIESFDTINDEDAAPKTQKPSEKSKKYQPRTITPTTDSDAELEKEQDEIKDSEEKISVDISVEDDLETKIIKTEKEKVQNPLVNNLNAINTSSANNSNCNDQIEESEKDDSELFIKNSASDLDLQESSQETVESLENAGLIIKNKKYEEIVEYVHPPNIPPSYKLNIDQDNTDPVYNDYKIPHFIYQELLKPEFDLNNYQNYNSYIPDSQQIEQIDGDTVVSYNNYFKMPTPMTSTNIRYQLLPSQNNNNNRYCSYLPVRQNQTSNNGWTYNRIHGNQAGDVDRIRKTWKNTEYYVKSKNALRKI